MDTTFRQQTTGTKVTGMKSMTQPQVLLKEKTHLSMSRMSLSMDLGTPTTQQLTSCCWHIACNQSQHKLVQVRCYHRDRTVLVGS